MTDKIEESSVKHTNTKKEILEAYGVLLKKYNDQAKAGFMAEDANKQKEEKELVEVAVSAQKDDVVNEILSLKDSVTKNFSELADKLARENQRYGSVQKAIDIKQKELKELFDIETTLFSLAALLETQKLKKAEFEDEMTREKEMLKEIIKETREQWEKEKQVYAQERKEQKAQEEKLRVREKEEYEYKTTRERALKEQELKDLLENSEREIQSQKETFEKEQSEKTLELRQRETIVSEKEDTFLELQKRVEGFPTELKERVDTEVTEAVTRLKTDAEKNEELLVKDFEGQKNVLATKIDSLDKLVVSQQGQIETLTNQIDDAYGKVQDIAVKAVYRQPEQQSRVQYIDDSEKRDTLKRER